MSLMSRTTKSRAEADAETVLLDVLKLVLSRYRQGEVELREELGIDEISFKLLMHICLAAVEVDDMVLGFIRDDLKVVSVEQQTRQLVERDIGYATGETGAPSVLDAAAVRTNKELRQFMNQNIELCRKVNALPHDVLVHMVMLGVMKETKGRAGGTRVIAAWRKSLSPAARQKLEARLKGDPNTQKQPGPKFSF
jgi:hypothetical protein